MNSRERINAVLDGNTPDRVPIDFGGAEQTGAHGISYNALKRHLGFTNGRTRITNLYQQIVEVEEEVRQRFSADVVQMTYQAKRWKPWKLPDGSPCEMPEGWDPVQLPDGSEALMGLDGEPVAKRLKGAYWFSPCSAVFPFMQTPEDVTHNRSVISILNRSAFLDETLEDLTARAKKIREETDYAIVGVIRGDVFASAQHMRGMAEFMMDLAANEDMANALMETLAEVHMEDYATYIEQMGPYVDVIAVGDDLGMQDGPQISPEMWRRLVKPHMARLYEFIKSKTDAKLYLHSCGSIYDFIPELIEMGVDILNPVQVTARNMDSKKLKDEFGKDVVFWGGGCDTQRVLSSGTVAEVRDEVKRRIDDLAPGGGFVFNQVHNIQPDVPPENIVAMFDAALEFGTY